MENKAEEALNRELREKDFEHVAEAIKGGEGTLKNPELIQNLIESYKGKTSSAPFEVIITSAILLNPKELIGTIEALKYSFKMKMIEEIKEKVDKGEASNEELISGIILASSIIKDKE